MTDIVGRLLEDDCSVVAFPVRESWIDIGDHPDYQQARESARAKEV